MTVLRCTNPKCPQPLKDETEFYPHRTSKTGRCFRCAECQRAAANSAYHKKKEAGVEPTEDQRERNRAAARKYSRSERALAYRRAWAKSENGKKCNAQKRSLPRTQYYVARNAARKRDIYFGLSFWDWMSVVAGMDCHYCGGPLPPSGGCLDRKDNDGAYIPSNVVPCCADCNWSKGDIFTYEEMVSAIGPAIRAVHLAREANRDAS